LFAPRLNLCSDLIDMDSPGSVRTAISLWFAAVATIAMAFMLEYVAHDDFGFTRQEIRTLSVMAATVIGVPMATKYFGRKRKPK
jgi:hypothetical protein